MSTLDQILADARKSYFDGLREAVHAQFADFVKMRNELHREELANGEPLTVFDLGAPGKTLDPEKSSGFGHRETEHSVEDAYEEFKYLLQMSGSKLHDECFRLNSQPELNKQHISRSLGFHKAWIRNMAKNSLLSVPNHRSLRKEYGILTELSGDYRLRWAVDLYPTMKNPCHVSVALGKSYNWVDSMMNQAKSKGMI